MTLDDWHTEARKRFGDDPKGWQFVCPSCGHIASVADWQEAGAPEGAIAFSCVGRWTGATKELCEKPGPCNYAGGGLIGLNPVEVDGHRVFAFAEPALVP